MIRSLNQNTYYPFLDSFRGWAVLWVMMAHVFTFFNLKPILGYFFLPFNMIARIGYLGVDMFFVMSGFLITGILVEGLDRPIRLRRFYIRRFFKIYPQYIAALFLGVGVYFLVFNSELGFANLSFAKTIMAHLFFIQNYTGEFAILEHTWSIAIEEHFYLLYSLMLFFVWKKIPQESQRRRTAIFLCSSLILLAHIFRFFSYQQDFQTTHYRFDALICGCLLKFLQPKFSSGKSSQNTYCVLVAISIYLLFIIQGFYYQWYEITLAYIAPACLLVAGLNNSRGIANFSWMRYIGKHSYAIYLWHYILIFPFKNLVSVAPEGVVILAYITTSLSIGVLSTISIERYFLNIRAKIVP